MAGEKNFENRIKQFLQAEKCWCLKHWGGGGFTKAGIPDLLICCNGRFIAVEVKGPGGRATDLQRYTLDQINNAGGLGLILYPNSFDQFKQLVKQINDLPPCQPSGVGGEFNNCNGHIAG